MYMKIEFSFSFIKYVVFATVALMGLVSLAHSGTIEDIKARGYMTVAIDPTFAPYEYFSENGEITGYSPRIMQAVADRLGVELRYQKMSFSGIIPGLIAGSFDAEASTLNVTKERAGKVLFTVPYGRTVNGVMVRSDNDFVGENLYIEDIAGKTVAVKSASTPEKIIRKISDDLEKMGLEPVSLLTVDTVEQTVSSLMTGRADFIFDDVSVLASIKQKLGGKLSIKGELGPSQWMAWATRKSDHALNKVMSDTILELQASGKLQAWQKEYLGVTFDVPASDFIPKQ
jgi:polar amino acid transport system substrate-binding protein